MVDILTLRFLLIMVCLKCFVYDVTMKKEKDSINLKALFTILITHDFVLSECKF